MSLPTCDNLRSERLQLSPYAPADLSELYAIQSDPSVSRFTYRPVDEADAEKRYAAHEAERATWGLAPWVVRRVGENRIIGHGGLGIDAFDPGWGPEVLYFFHPDYWGCGYATELARHAVVFAFETLGLERICSFARPGNTASVRVLEKVGFRKQEYLEAMERDYYVLTSEELS